MTDKRLLDMEDFRRLSKFLNHGDPDGLSLAHIETYLELLRINARHPGAHFDSTLAHLRDLIAEETGVTAEIVHVSFEDLVAEERHKHLCAMADEVFGTQQADLTDKSRDGTLEQTEMLDWYFARIRHTTPGSITLSETFEAGFAAGLSHHTRIEV